mgnify:CR=1 FL=1
MREALIQSIENLRAHKLRSVLTMFGIVWGVVSIVILSAMSEGFQRGNLAVLPGETGGKVVGGVTPAALVGDVFRESASYYVLGFQPASTIANGTSRTDRYALTPSTCAACGLIGTTS